MAEAGAEVSISARTACLSVNLSGTLSWINWALETAVSAHARHDIATLRRALLNALDHAYHAHYL